MPKKIKSLYVDGYVLPVPKKNLAAYKKMAHEGGKMWIKHGALEYFECAGEDMKPNMGGMKLLTFPQLAKTKPTETVIFAFIIYKSRAHRDQVNNRVMKDPSMNDLANKDKAMPFDVKRTAFGGFTTIVHHKKA